MDYAVPGNWVQGQRGFWTRRKRSATSLLAICALITGIAVAYKLFDRTVPNNVVRDASTFDFQVHVQRPPSACTQTVPNDTQWCITGSNDPIYKEAVDTYPGDARTEQVRIRNTNSRPKKEASFEMYVDQANIVVRGCTAPDQTTGVCATTPVISSLDVNWSKFVNFWTFNVTKERYIEAPDPIGEFPDSRGKPSGYVAACSGQLTTITKNSPCRLGLVRANGTTNAQTKDRLDDRYFQYVLAEEDTGTDQSFYKGWTITFPLVFGARLGAQADATTLVTRQ